MELKIFMKPTDKELEVKRNKCKKACKVVKDAEQVEAMKAQNRCHASCKGKKGEALDKCVDPCKRNDTKKRMDAKCKKQCTDHKTKHKLCIKQCEKETQETCSVTCPAGVPQWMDLVLDGCS